MTTISQPKCAMVFSEKYSFFPEIFVSQKSCNLLKMNYFQEYLGEVGGRRLP